MVDRTKTMVKIGYVKQYGWAVYETQVSKNDILTLDEFSNAENITHALLINNATHAEVTCTKALNVITVTGEGTNLDCVLFVYGVRV